MNQDIDSALGTWEFKPNEVQARIIEATDGRSVLQLRVDLGILQMEMMDRPDGTRPHGCATYFDYLRRQAARSRGPFTLTEEQCAEADREFIQYYQRRICWRALRNHTQAMADADHTLALMDFVRDHSPSEEYTQAHEQYRGFVTFHRTQAAAAQAVEKDDPEAALDAIHAGLEGLRDFFASYNAEEQMEDDLMVQQLRNMDRSLRKLHNIEATLQEQLEQAIAREQYEVAARLRDEIRRKHL
jgi:hypothetical protein